MLFGIPIARELACTKDFALREARLAHTYALSILSIFYLEVVLDHDKIVVWPIFSSSKG